MYNRDRKERPNYILQYISTKVLFTYIHERGKIHFPHASAESTVDLSHFAACCSPIIHIIAESGERHTQTPLLGGGGGVYVYIHAHSVYTPSSINHGQPPNSVHIIVVRMKIHTTSLENREDD